MSALFIPRPAVPPLCAALPPYGLGVVAVRTVPHGYIASGAPPGSVLPPAPGVVPEVRIASFPPAGALAPITGTILGLPVPSQYRVVLYIQDADGVNWWYKVRASAG